MTPLFSHHAEVIKDSPKGLTLYFFEVWALELSDAIFNELKNHHQIVIIPDFKSSEEKLADHCQFLQKENSKFILTECHSCSGESSFWNNCWSPGEPEWIECSACKGTGEQVIQELVGIERVRVSIAALVNLTNKGSTILIKGSKGEAKPLGGAYEFIPGAFFMKKNFITLDKPESLDLRFSLPTAEVPELKHWFYTKKEREVNPLRELKEELCDENQILSKKSWDEFINN